MARFVESPTACRSAFNDVVEPRLNRSGFLFGRIFFDEPVSTPSENALCTPYLTVMVIFSETIGGTWGICARSPSNS